MFTGIIEEKGSVADIEKRDDSARISIACSTVIADAHRGDSIAVNGACLTVTDVSSSSFSADIMNESLDKTALGSLETGAAVNLERAVAAGARLGGHIVQGHVDGTGAIVSRERAEHWDLLTIAVPDGLRRYIAAKGSVAVDGVSLTVADVIADGFAVGLIPATLAATTLGDAATYAETNIEVDILAKYVESLGLAR